MTADFSQADLESLREQGIVVFEDRVIFDAQPPIDPDTLSSIAAKCSGPIPEQLLELWSQTAGGSINYDVSIELDGGVHGFSWTELFYNGATTYFDLAGWIESELENLEEHCHETNTPFPGVLKWLPIGGFEYLDRVYVCVEPGEDYGSVAFWMKGIPPSWTHRLHRDAMVIAAPTLRDAFSLLRLRVQPSADLDEYHAGQTFYAYVDTRVAEHGMDQQLAVQVKECFSKAVLEWRWLLDAGLIRKSPPNLAAAFDDAIRNDDPEVVERLADLGENFRSPLSGTAVAVDVALIRGAENVLRALLRARAWVPLEALAGVNSPLPVDIVKSLISRGARPTFEAAAQLVAVGAPESGRTVARACPGLRTSRKAGDMTRATRALASRLRADLDQVHAGTLFHHLGADGLALRIERLESFVF